MSLNCENPNQEKLNYANYGVSDSKNEHGIKIVDKLDVFAGNGVFVTHTWTDGQCAKLEPGLER